MVSTQADVVRRGREERNMHHQTIGPADPAPRGAILALKSELAAAALAELMPFDRAIIEALDRVYGTGKWFMFWDEDLGGKPIRGTVSLAFGRERLVIG
jgi:hypothetical protein